MFKMGGPIKEGIMDGMKNSPQQLVKSNADGSRPGYAGPLAIPVVAGLNALRIGATAAARRAIPKIASFFRTQVGTKTVPKQGPTGIGPVKVTRGPGGTVTRSSTKLTPGTGEAPIFAPTYLGRDPTVRLIGGTYKAVTDPKVAGLAGKAARFVFSPTGILTGAYFAGGKFFDSDGNEIKNAKEKGLTAGGKIGTSGVPGGGDPGMYLGPQVKERGGGVELTAEERRKKNVERYRDIMDIKGMNKEAAYDSLIAASQAVNQAGGDLKGSIRDGSLINQIIQSTSKAFDKPKATKDAIDTLILKGEIEKDIKASDPSNEILNRLREVQIKKGLKDIDTGFAEAKIAARKTESGQKAFDVAAAVASDNFKGNLITVKQISDVLEGAKKEGDISEQDIIIKATQEVIKGKNLPDGDYTVGDVLVTIQEGQVIDLKR
jgi:hypothetical protein